MQTSRKRGLRATTFHREGMAVMDFSQSPERLGKATQLLYEAVMTGGLVHDGNPVLARHVNNAVLRYDSQGRGRIVKPQKSSEAHVDAAQAAVFAFEGVVRRPGVGMAWLQHWNDEIAEQKAALPVSPATPAPPRAAEFFDHEGMRPRALCTHRWMEQGGGQYLCVNCGRERES
jgi:Phage Terminase